VRSPRKRKKGEAHLLERRLVALPPSFDDFPARLLYERWDGAPIAVAIFFEVGKGDHEEGVQVGEGRLGRGVADGRPDLWTSGGSVRAPVKVTLDSRRHAHLVAQVAEELGLVRALELLDRVVVAQDAAQHEVVAVGARRRRPEDTERVTASAWFAGTEGT